ncbi:MAG: tRNA (N(6)-L-threonylcarbamoyladenosine(37)-C(2))-methylthiotransferase MtaB [Eubacteriales bacterium]|nr:tRNA (N(6)-L-threonylcarbamoyladenosine(37)-C(2))-methylthiotransferase MtaB [Eubacteriales bacterium]MDD4122477.1 tRNA (N(6)-L-threonylcarbamoyladenosine(37)-C(2))-methylthiotransferase MtaB [Eubacteriales bacterium]MDD4629893.1 tRNA (N(6)-L-threonylcarbamoyladenosine(37)-C(2))-methylthiotransferase MtaB [Eubacteriales bacterium]
MKIAFHTLGCKVNQYETQALKEKFMNKGYEIVGEDEYSDIYIINTCTVTGLADRKSRQFIRKVKKINPESVTAVIGCYAQVSPEEAKAIEGVNIVVGTNEKNRLIDYIENYVNTNSDNVDCHINRLEQLTEYEETGIITSMDSRSRAYIKVQEGCNRFCSYCIIPFARGTVRSREKDEIIKEAQSLIGQGFKEIVLTGINTALYGTDNMKINGLMRNLEEVYGIEVIVNLINGLTGDFRIRLGSLEPNVIHKEYAKRLLKYERLCPHMHLSLQSGSDRILSAMNRSYNIEEYMQLVNILRDHDSGYGITTDIIVGFPGETEKDFEESCRLVQKAGFCKVHVFKYSKREGTKAANMSDHIAPEIKKRRSDKLIRIAEETANKFFLSQLGTVRKVLFEKYDEATGLLDGLSDNNIKVFSNGDKNMEGKFVLVELFEPCNGGVKGKIINKI